MFARCALRDGIRRMYTRAKPQAAGGSSMRYGFTCILIAFCVSSSRANDTIEGVQPAAMDQPRVYVNLRSDRNKPPLHTSDKDRLSGDEAFLDTGASGIMLSADTVQKLGVAREQDTTFQDVGVGGGEEFGVSEPLYLAVAKYPKSDPENLQA